MVSKKRLFHTTVLSSLLILTFSVTTASAQLSSENRQVAETAAELAQLQAMNAWTTGGPIPAQCVAWTELHTIPGHILDARGAQRPITFHTRGTFLKCPHIGPSLSPSASRIQAQQAGFPAKSQVGRRGKTVSFSQSARCVHAHVYGSFRDSRSYNCGYYKTAWVYFSVSGGAPSSLGTLLWTIGVYDFGTSTYTDEHDGGCYDLNGCDFVGSETPYTGEGVYEWIISVKLYWQWPAHINSSWCA